jgi:hypothetical protein
VKVKKHINLIILLALLVGNNIFWVRRESNMADRFLQYTATSQYVSSIDKSTIDNLERLLDWSYFTFSLGEDNQSQVQLARKVALYITQGNCYSCVTEMLPYLNQLTSAIGIENVVVLGNFDSEASFNDFASQIGGFVKHYIFFPDPGFPDTLNKQPIVFYIDDHRIVRNIYIPDFYPEFKEKLFSKILPNLYNELHETD